MFQISILPFKMGRGCSVNFCKARQRHGTILFKLPEEGIVLDLKGRLWVFRISPKILTVSDQYFLSYVRKTTRGGVSNCLTPPAGPINEKEKVDHISVEYKEFNEIFGDYWEFIEKLSFSKDTKKIFEESKEFNAEKKKIWADFKQALCVVRN